MSQKSGYSVGFNTQPPEGGWQAAALSRRAARRFQHTAARRRLAIKTNLDDTMSYVSTHSRPKAAGLDITLMCRKHWQFQHTAARRRLDACSRAFGELIGFQHTAARRRLAALMAFFSASSRFQHTAARRRLVFQVAKFDCVLAFQHTAARRRLGIEDIPESTGWFVSTHSRPKAAGQKSLTSVTKNKSFNTQPPEGGWSDRRPTA